MAGSILLLTRLEESASHPTSPFVVGKGSATSCRMHPRVEIRGIEAISFRSCIKFTAPLGPRGRGSSLRAFLLLAALQVVGAFCRVSIDSLMMCCIVHSILP